MKRTNILTFIVSFLLSFACDGNLLDHHHGLPQVIEAKSHDNKKHSAKKDHKTSSSSKHKHRDKGKDRQKPPSLPTAESLSIEQVLQKLNAFSNEKSDQARKIEASISRRLDNIEEVVTSLNQVADCYESAAHALEQTLKITYLFANRAELDATIHSAVSSYRNTANKYRQDANQWPIRIIEVKHSMVLEFERLHAEGDRSKEQGLLTHSRESYSRAVSLLESLIDIKEQDASKLHDCEKKLTELWALTDARKLTPESPPSENFEKEQNYRRSQFFQRQDQFKDVPNSEIALDGQGSELYTNQFYRYLVQQTSPCRSLNVKVTENGLVVHQENISLPVEESAWNQHLGINDNLYIPKTQLSSQYGLDLRITAVHDPYYSSSWIISQKGSNNHYAFSFYLDEKPLFDVRFMDPLPWQLEMLCSPAPLSKENLIPLCTDIGSLSPNHKITACHPVEALTHSILDQFVEKMGRDPLALAQYVCNEIELMDPFHNRDDKVFHAPSIHRNPLRTFLEQQGSPWEQCFLLVHLLQRAGHQAQYLEGSYVLPASYVEKLLFLQLPGEQEVVLNYPGVLLFDGNEWHTVFPWMKDIHIEEGHELYSLMPEEYCNAEKWLKGYLCNEEAILKHVGADHDDSAGVLFVRFVEEQLRRKGFSLHDVGTHRIQKKRQFFNWNDFPRAEMRGQPNVLANLSERNDLFANIQITIYSEQNPAKKVVSQAMHLAAFSCSAFAIYFTPVNSNDHVLHFCSTDQWTQELLLPLDRNDATVCIEVDYKAHISPQKIYPLTKRFSIAKGTCAAICHQSGSTNAKVTSFYAEQFASTTSSVEKLPTLLSFVGTAYYEKCSRSAKILATLHKMVPTTTFSIGLAKLSPTPGSNSDLRYPQVDMHMTNYTQDHLKHPFSLYQNVHHSFAQYNTLAVADWSSNEHQVLREIYQDPYAISTTKLLQIAHQKHARKRLPGIGFLTLTHKSFFDADTMSEVARQSCFSHFQGLDLQRIKNEAPSQWNRLRQLFVEKNQTYAYAYMTPGPVSSLDGYGLIPPSYTGYGTLVISPGKYIAMISNGSQSMNGGYGSRLKDNFIDLLDQKNWNLVSNGDNYSFISAANAPLFNGVTSQIHLPTFNLDQEKERSFAWWQGSLWSSPISKEWKADVRLEHKSVWEGVSDPVDVVTGAFYVDEVDLNLPGPFPLEIRRNYNSQNPIPGNLGFGWKLSLNPVLFEENNKLFAAEQDGTVIVYRFDEGQNRWIVHPDDNPDLRNTNRKGIGGTANPFHAYIEKKDGYILYGSDGSIRVFHDNLLQSWTDHAGNTLTFTYDQERLSRIESSNGHYLQFEYNYSGKIAEVFSKDGRHISYTYDSQGNLATVKLPNDAVISYDYDRFHRIMRETKPHGRVLENIYKDDKVIEQRSPVGQQQKMATSALFNYENDVTIVTDASGGSTEYKIHKKQIYKITDPLGFVTLQSWFLDDNSYFDAETEQVLPWNKTGGWQRSLKSTTDKRGLTINYLYDEHCNIHELTLTGDDLTGKGDTSVSKHFTYNVNNLCIQEKTLNTKTITTYDATYPYLPKRVEQFVDDIHTSCIDLEYTLHGMVSKRNDSGAITLFEYDDRDFPIKKTQKTGTDDPDVVTSFHYNNQGQCKRLITADSIQHNEYDIMGNCYRSTTSLPSGKIISQTYASYDLNNELIWKQGNDPNDTLFLDYNAAGFLKASRKNLSQFNGSSIEPAGVAYSLYEYDACGRLLEQVDPLGNCTYCDYDALGRIKHSTKHGLTTTFTYEAGGLVATVTTPSGATASRSYTTNGLLKSEIYPDDTKITHIYDFMGRPIQETINGVSLTVRYNDSVHEEIRSQGELTEIRQFDAHGNLLSFTDRAGFTWTKTYDALNRVKTETSPNGDITKWNYQGDTIVCTLPSGEKTIERYEAGALAESKTLNSNGSLINTTCYRKSLAQSMTEEIHGDIVTTTWTNTLGLPVHIQQGSKVTTHYYDACGNCVVSVDREGNITHQEFDSLGRLEQKKLPDGALITYEYDADSNLIAYHMPGNLTWKATYDSVGHKCSEWQEMNGAAFQRWEYAYANGLLSQTKDPLNRLHQYTYDIHSRLVEEQVGNYSRIYTYDPRGLLASVTESGKDTSKIERTYDESGRLISEIISLNEITIQNTRQEWTPSSRSLKVGDHRRDFHYQSGRLQGLTSKGINLSYNYALSGSLIKKTTPFSSVGIQYNDSALPQAIDVQLQGNKYSESLQWTQGGRFAFYDSTYPETHSATYNYNERGFLKSTQDDAYTFDFDKPGRGILTAAPSFEVSDNELDKFGRIAKELFNSMVRAIAYDDMGQVIAHGDQRLSWDPWGRLIAVKSDTSEWTASYDAFGRRLQTNYTPILKGNIWNSKEHTIVTTSLYDPEQEFQEIGVISKEKILWKMYEGASCAAIVDSNGEVAVLHHDSRNNLIAVVNSQTTQWNGDYPTPYGPRAPPKAKDSELVSYALSLTWQSKRADPTGLIWLGARYYDPTGGRFLSPDPVSHPVCLDLYAYANGDPINNTDLDGLFATSVYDTVASISINDVATFPLKINCFYQFKELISPSDPSRLYDLSDLGRPELPNNLYITALNGMGNTHKQARANTEHISNLCGGHNIHAVYGATRGFRNDIITCVLGMMRIDTGPPGLLQDRWKAIFDNDPNAYVLHIPHSRGCIETDIALSRISEERRKRITVAAFAPGGFIDEKTCAYLIHYRAKAHRDPIPYLCFWR
ncbi:MAG: DUF6531 domain-containing protein, partial [Parachlamydiaceae bacterium]